MDREKLRDAVAYIKTTMPCYTEEDEAYHAQILIDLAEIVLAVGGKMPRRKDILEGEDIECFTANDMNRASNETLDECTLAFASMLDREKLYSILGKSIEFDEDGNAWTNHTKAVDAILSAMYGNGK